MDGLSVGAIALGNVLGGVITTVVSQISGMVKSVVDTGIQFDALKEQSQVAFTTMLGSGQAAQDMLNELQAFAQKTPFEFPDLITASQRLMAMGFHAEEVIPTLTAIGDAVAAMGGSSAMVDRVTTAIGQMNAKGKVSAEEMRQLTEAGIPAWQMLADKLGVSVAEAMDEVSGKTKKVGDAGGVAFRTLADGTLQALPKMRSVKGAMDDAASSGVSAAIGIQALTEGIEQRFGGMMDKQSTTWNGIISNIKDGFTQLSGAIMQPFFDIAKVQLGAFATTITEFAKSMQGEDSIVAAFRNFFNLLQGGQDLLPSLSLLILQLLPDSWKETWIGIDNAITSFVTSVGEIVGPIAEAAASFVTWSDALGGIGVLLLDAFGPVIVAAIGGFVAAFGPVIALFAAATAASAALRTAWETDWAGINTTLTGIWNELVNSNDTLGQKLVFVWNSLVTFAQSAWNSIVTTIQTMLPTWITTLQGWADAAWQWIVDVVPVVLDKLGEWFSSIVGWLGEQLPQWMKAFVEWETALFQWIDDTLPKAIEALAGFVRGLRGEGESNGGTAFASMASGWAGKLWKWITEELIPAVRPAFTKFVGTMTSLGQDLLSALGTLAVELGKTLWQWIVDITPVALKKLADWGGELWDWIKTNAPTWLDYLNEWGEAAWTWIRDTAIPEAVKKIGEWGAALWGWLTDNVPKWVAALGDWAKAAWTWIIDDAWPKTKENISKWFDNLKSWVAENWPKWRDEVVQKGRDLMQWLTDGIGDGIATMQNWLRKQGWFGGVANDILNLSGIGGGYEVWHKSGEEIVVGVRDGMSSRTDELRQQGWLLGEATQTGLKDNMDMHSPSRVMYGYGSDIAQGLLNAVASYASQFAEAGSAMGNGIANGLRSSFDVIAEQVKSAMALANATFQDEVATFARQAAATYQQQYLDAVKKIQALPPQTSGKNPVSPPPLVGGIGGNSPERGDISKVPVQPQYSSLSSTLFNLFGNTGGLQQIVDFANNAYKAITAPGQSQLQGSSAAYLGYKELTGGGVSNDQTGRVISALLSLIEEMRDRNVDGKVNTKAINSLIDALRQGTSTGLNSKVGVTTGLR